MLEWIRKGLGFVILFTASMTFIDYTDQVEMNYVVAIFWVLLIFAWTDYMKLIIYLFPAFGAMAGFFLGNLEGLFYALPVGIVYLIFAYLTSTNREKSATFAFIASVPLALVMARFFPQSGTAAWGLIGLMAGIIENAITEDAAEGDIFIISLYFMALGPFAFIPFALQNFTGNILFEREYGDRSVYPLGPAMFIVSVPLLILIGHMASTNAIPEWLLYGYYHGVTNARLAVIGALIGTYLIPRLMHSDGGSESEDLRITLGGGTMGAVAGLVAGLLAFVLVGGLSLYLDKLGYENLSIVFALLAVFAPFLVGLVAFAIFSQLHYEGKSSIDDRLWTWGLMIVSIILSAYLMRYAWDFFKDSRELALGTGLLVFVLFHTTTELGESLRKYPTLENVLWGITVYGSAFLAGLWTGFGMVWILQ